MQYSGPTTEDYSRSYQSKLAKIQKLQTSFSQFKLRFHLTTFSHIDLVVTPELRTNPFMQNVAQLI